MNSETLTIIMIAVLAIVLAPFALSFAVHFLAVCCQIVCQFIEACVRGLAWLCRLPGSIILAVYRKVTRR